MINLLYLLLFCLSTLYGVEEAEIFMETSLPMAASFDDFDKSCASPAAFQMADTVHFAPELPKVNVSTGEYVEEAVDLVVAGAQPLSLRRFYNHLEPIPLNEKVAFCSFFRLF